jgi:hypothetical protein
LNWYPFSSAFILDDTTFTAYGGDSTLGIAAQRAACYWLAEKKVSENLNTFLKPVTVTGTFAQVGASIILDHAYINYVTTVRFIDTEEVIYFTASGTASEYFSLRNDVYGILDIHYLVAHCSVCHSHGALNYPYQVQVVYNAGMPTGTSIMPDVLLALTTYAKLMLNEIIGYGNEAPGDVGIEEFSSQQYREVRRIQNTDFGNSPQAIFANRLLRGLRKHRYVGM